MIIGIGETILDIIFKNDKPQAASPGGSTFNAMISLGRVMNLSGDSSSLPSGEGGVRGHSPLFITEVGDDHVGDVIVNYLVENGVSAEYVNRRKNSQSHVSLAFLNDQNDAQYEFYKDHAHAMIADNFPEIKKGDIVLFGSFFAVNPVLRPIVKTFLENASKAGAFLYYDINFRASHIKDIPEILPAIEENMKLSTVVRGSLEDFQYLYGSPLSPQGGMSFDGKDDSWLSAEEVYDGHIKLFCPCFICTNGGKPVELFTPAMKAQFETEPVETVSTIGAGDNFNAGFVYAVEKLMHDDTSLCLETLPLETWKPLIASGQRFSSAVCQSFENSVPKDFNA